MSLGPRRAATLSPLRAGPGADALEGGPGNDLLHAGGNDGAADVVDCGAGFDRAVIRRGDVALDCERVRVRAGSWDRPPGRRIRGTAADDELTGTERRDLVFGRAGDTILGLGGSDFLFGNRGNDSLDGGEGRDFLWGGSHGDVLHGGPANDWLWAGAGADGLFGDMGNDRLHAAADDGADDTLDCGENEGDRDRAVLRPGDTAVDCERVRTLSP